MEVHMPRLGRPKKLLVLTDDERETLERWERRPKSPQSLALRSKIVLACAEGPTNREVAARLGVAEATVGKWRSRFVAKRLDGLVDEARPGSPRTVTDDAVEAVIVKTLQEKPDDATHWSTRSMAKTTGMSQSAISRIWRAFGLKPHLVDTFKLSSDPLFIDKVRDIVGLYLCPPDHPVVLCVDEKTQVQALDRTQPIFPLLPGVPESRRQLQAKRNHRPLCRPQARHWGGHPPVHPPAPGHRVQEVSRAHRQVGAEGTRRPHRHRQPLDPQDPGHQEVATRSPQVPLALHADIQLMAELGRTMVRGDH